MVGVDVLRAKYAGVLVVVVLCVVLGGTLSACSGARMRTYDGPERPLDQVAVLKPQRGWNSPSVYFVRIDDRVFERFSYADLELLPGKHEVEFGYDAVVFDSFSGQMLHSFSTQNAYVVFDAEAGHEYVAWIQPYVSDPIGMGRSAASSWFGLIYDRGTGAPVGVSRMKP